MHFRLTQNSHFLKFNGYKSVIFVTSRSFHSSGSFYTPQSYIIMHKVGWQTLQYWFISKSVIFKIKYLLQKCHFFYFQYFVLEVSNIWCKMMRVTSSWSVIYNWRLCTTPRFFFKNQEFIIDIYRWTVMLFTICSLLVNLSTPITVQWYHVAGYIDTY